MHGSPSVILSGQIEVMHGPEVMQEKLILVADRHAQLIVRVNKLLAASHPVKGDGGIDGGRAGSLCDVLCGEGSERECAGKQIYPLLPLQSK